MPNGSAVVQTQIWVTPAKEALREGKVAPNSLANSPGPRSLLLRDPVLSSERPLSLKDGSLGDYNHSVECHMHHGLECGRRCSGS